MDQYFMEHIRDLSRKSETQGIYTFTSFLSAAEQSEILTQRQTLAPVAFFGGAEGTQRNVARFGSAEELGYEAPWDIVCLRIRPVNAKFADTLSHRDFLGTLMGTGLRRDKIGDIVVRDNAAFVFTDTATAAYLTENVKTVRHTTVSCAVCAELPQDVLQTVEKSRFVVSSLRADCLIAAVWHLSRTDAAAHFQAKRVFVNDVLCENVSYNVKDGDTVSVRGYGKFRFTGIAGSTKKGRLSAEAELYR